MSETAWEQSSACGKQTLQLIGIMRSMAHGRCTEGIESCLPGAWSLCQSCTNHSEVEVRLLAAETVEDLCYRFSDFICKLDTEWLVSQHAGMVYALHKGIGRDGDVTVAASLYAALKCLGMEGEASRSIGAMCPGLAPETCDESGYLDDQFESEAGSSPARFLSFELPMQIIGADCNSVDFGILSSAVRAGLIQHTQIVSATVTTSLEEPVIVVTVKDRSLVLEEAFTRDVQDIILLCTDGSWRGRNLLLPNVGTTRTASLCSTRSSSVCFAEAHSSEVLEYIEDTSLAERAKAVDKTTHSWLGRWVTSWFGSSTGQHVVEYVKQPGGLRPAIGPETTVSVNRQRALRSLMQN